MNTHLSQSIGAGAFEGQHGMSLAISSAVADTDASAIADIAASMAAPAMTGRDSGAKANPAIIRIASSRRMVTWRFTPPKSHRTAQIDSPAGANDAVIGPRPGFLNAIRKLDLRLPHTPRSKSRQSLPGRPQAIAAGARARTPE